MSWGYGFSPGLPSDSFVLNPEKRLSSDRKRLSRFIPLEYLPQPRLRVQQWKEVSSAPDSSSDDPGSQASWDGKLL